MSANLLFRKLTVWRRACARVKTSRDNNATRDSAQPEVTSRASDPQDDTTNLLEVCNVCLAAMLGPCVFSVSGLIAAYVSGPAAGISALIATAAVTLTVQSVRSLSSRSLKYLQTSVYELVYRQCGELLAVVAGCLLTLRHLAYTAFICRSVGQNVDLLANGVVSNWTANHIGGLAVLDSRLDLLAGVVAACASVAVLLPRLETSVGRFKQQLSAASNAQMFVCLLFTAVIALFHVHWTNWSTPQQFFTGGVRALFSAATGFYFTVDVCYEITHNIQSTGHVMRRLSVTSSATVLPTVLIAAVAVTSLTTLTAPEVPANWTSGSPFAECFEMSGVKWMKYCVCIFAIIALLPAAILNLRRAQNIMGQMMNDGLLMTSQGGSGSESVCWRIVVVIVTFVGSVACNMTSLIGLVSVCALALHLLTVVCSLKARYQPYSNTTRRRHTSHRTRTRTRQSTSGTDGDSRYGTTSSVGCSTSCVPRQVNREEQLDTTSVINRHNGTIATTTTAATTSSAANRVNRPVSIVAAAAAADGDDDDELLGHSDTSSRPHTTAYSSSSDTDIDDVVDEYEQHCVLAAVQHQADQQLIDVRCPTPQTHRRALYSLAVFTASCFVIFLVTAHASNLAHPVSVSVLVVTGAAVVASCSYVVYLPCNDVTALTSRGRNVRGGRWVALVSVGVNTCLLAFSSSTVFVIFTVYTSLCVVGYLLYGVGHSNEAKTLQHVPEEQRILLPASDPLLDLSTENYADDSSDTQTTRQSIHV